MQLTAHFSLEELTASDTAARAAINNVPPQALMGNLLILAQGLEQVRTLLGGLSIHVTSGYRCLELNKKIGGARNSAHMQALAADIICPAFGSPLEICRKIAHANIPFEQMIHEFGHWCHIEFAIPPAAGKRELLSIADAATGYRTGLH